TPWLDGKHAIFGEIDAESVAILKNIARQPRGAGDRPHQDVVMEKVRIFRA
ncbi:MAG: peptidylprolyl isomerase, partial [Myxococcales bacterium]|nr:peptidylprolyl isomerase [Myxococcales bacterium]